MPTAAISGSHGFIGSHLCQVLLSKGWEVFPITQEVLYSPNDLREFFNQTQPDYIFHLAAFGNMSKQTDIAMTVMANIIGTFNMLKESLDIPYKAFLNFGSSSEYGRKSQAMAETDILLPETFYGASKAGATHLAYAFAKQYQKPIVTVRPFSIYGEGEADFRFIPTVIRNMIEKKPFPLDVHANHDWVYIEDFLNALFIILDKAPNLADKVINIGTGRMHTNKEVCDLLKRATGMLYTMTPITGMRKNDSEVWMADNSYITRLGWYPKTMLMEGLKKTFEWYRAKYEKLN